MKRLTYKSKNKLGLVYTVVSYFCYSVSLTQAAITGWLSPAINGNAGNLGYDFEGGSVSASDSYYAVTASDFKFFESDGAGGYAEAEMQYTFGSTSNAPSTDPLAPPDVSFSTASGGRNGYFSFSITVNQGWMIDLSSIALTADHYGTDYQMYWGTMATNNNGALHTVHMPNTASFEGVSDGWTEYGGEFELGSLMQPYNQASRLGAGASLEFRIGALDLETGGFADFLLDNVELEMTAHPDFTWGLVPPLPAPPVLPPPGSISLPEDWLADPVPVGGVVPEPTSALMLGLGSCLVFQRRSRAEKK